MILTTKKAAHIAKFAEFVWFVWLCSNVQTVLWGKNCAFGIIPIYFQVTDFWFYGNLTGNIRYLTRFGKPDIFGNKPVQQRKKDRKLSEPVHYINQLQFQVQLPLWTSPNKLGSTITIRQSAKI